MDFTVEPSRVHDAELTVPGDKSISHRALMLGSIAEGETTIKGFLPGQDCLATLQAFRAMGVRIDALDATTLTVHGVGLHGLTRPDNVLDLGNSGTAMRLLTGLLAGQRFDSTLIGDESLSRRPMARIIDPLTSMGAVIESDCDGTPPLEIRGGLRLTGIDYATPVASAQVKSCLLLAGLYANGVTTITEPAITRDHTERMLTTMGVELELGKKRVSLAGGQVLKAAELEVPADLSSAAFVMLAAILADAADVRITNVGINPTRTGVIDILTAMGADITLENTRMFGSEPVADIRVRSSTLLGCDVDPSHVSLAIDEFPLLFVAAAAATGTTRFRGIGELRVKESDRIAAMATGLRALGIRIDEFPDGALVHGGRFGGGVVESFGDHRIAMSLAVAATAASDEVIVRGVDNVETSFPGFVARVAELGVRIAVREAA